MKILQVIGHFFSDLFNGAKKAYEHLSPEEQAALQQGAGLVDIINKNLSATPSEIRALIQAKFPAIDEAHLESTLFQAAASFGLTSFTSLDDVIVAIQKHLSAHTGKVWEAVSHGLAVVVSILFAPPEAKVASFASLMEWVYQTFIKKG